MAYDALANGAAAAAPRDIVGAGKKKRGNRSAKLKQCKLDARREQWISQGKNKDYKFTSMAASPTSTLPPSPISVTRGSTGESYYKQGNDSSDSESTSRSPISSGHSSRGNRIVQSNYRTVSDVQLDHEDRSGENEPLDDWEAVADVLFADCGGQDPVPSPAPLERPTEPVPAMQVPVRTIPRAWKPDDTARPRSLPSLSKQQSFLVSMGRQCGLPYPCGVESSPIMCPICCEDLDVTDTSFLPCLCGFRLCLFCYKRILEEDGRCPGCRKKYISVVGKATDGDSGGRDSLKLSRSLSLSSRP